MNYTHNIRWASFCLALLLSQMPAFTQAQPRLAIVNPDKRGYFIKGEMVTLHLSIFRAKQAYMIGIQINGRRLPLNEDNFPIKKYTHIQQVNRLGSVDIAIKIDYIYRGTTHTFRRIYPVKVVQQDSNKVRKLYFHHTHMRAAYKNAQGRPIKVGFKGDTQDFDIHQNAGTLYFTPKKIKKSILEVFYQGKKIDRLQFDTQPSPRPEITPLFTSISGLGFSRTDLSSDSILGLKLEFPSSYFRATSPLPFKYRIKSYEVLQHREC